MDGKRAWRGESWKRVACGAEGSEGVVAKEEEGLSHGVGRKAPKMMGRGDGDSCEGVADSSDGLPPIRRRVGACQDITWREKELREVPWVVVK